MSAEPVPTPYAHLHGEPTVRAYIRALNFDQMLDKITSPEMNAGLLWPREIADKAIQQYKNYLYLMYKYRHRHPAIPPSLEIDEMWHAHILDTRRYHQDCERIFGEYLHHYPYLGLRGEQDRQYLHSSYEVTKSLYQAEFGEPLLALIAIEP